MSCLYLSLYLRNYRRDNTNTKIYNHSTELLPFYFPDSVLRILNTLA